MVTGVPTLVLSVPAVSLTSQRKGVNYLINTYEAMRINLFGNLRFSFAGKPVTAVNTNRLHSLYRLSDSAWRYAAAAGDGWPSCCGRPRANRRRGRICGSCSTI